MKITIIGAGNMGGAIAVGLGYGSIIKPADIVCADKSQDALDKIKAIHPAVQTATDNVAAIKDADIVVLAVKPWLIGAVCDEIRESLDYERQIIVSIAGGVALDDLDGYLKSKKGASPVIFRIIPNTAVAVRQSMTFIASRRASQQSVDLLEKIFSELGDTMVVEERLLGAATSLSSCGIAYAFRYIRAAMEGGVELGFYPVQAKDIILQTLRGAVELMTANKSHPEEEIDKVTTPGGMTIRGLNEMENAGFTAAVIRGLRANR